MHINARFLSSIAFSLLVVAGQASATTIQTSSYSTWVASLTGSPTESSLNYGSASYNTAAGWATSMGTYGTFTVTGPDNGGYSLNGTTYSGLSGLLAANDGIGGMAIATPAGVTGILLGIGITGNAAPVTIILSDGESFVINPAVNGTALFGLSLSSPITSVYLSTANGSAVVLDDLWAGVSNLPASGGPTSPASEGATILLISGGLVFLGAKRKIFSNVSIPRRNPAPVTV